MIAIVIPYFKINFFQATLQSLSNQTDKRFRVYIGNDASNQDPSDLIKSFHGKLNITYKRFEENLGGKSLVMQWERCIEMIQEEKWIMILGDDDVLESSVIQTFYNHLDRFRKRSKVIRFATKIISEETNNISEIFNHPEWEKVEDSFYRKFKGLTRSSLSEYIFEKDSYLKWKFYPYPLAWHSDDRACFEFSEETPLYTINESIVFVRTSSINISGRTDNEFQKNLASVSFYKYIIENKLQYYHIEQQLTLLRAYENEIMKGRKLKIKELLLLIFYHIKIFQINSIKKLLKRFLKSL